MWIILKHSEHFSLARIGKPKSEADRSLRKRMKLKAQPKSESECGPGGREKSAVCADSSHPSIYKAGRVSGTNTYGRGMGGRLAGGLLALLTWLLASYLPTFSAVENPNPLLERMPQFFLLLAGCWWFADGQAASILRVHNTTPTPTLFSAASCLQYRGIVCAGSICKAGWFALSSVLHCSVWDDFAGRQEERTGSAVEGWLVFEPGVKLLICWMLVCKFWVDNTLDYLWMNNRILGIEGEGGRRRNHDLIKREAVRMKLISFFNLEFRVVSWKLCHQALE
jgi:hypothetical protein